MNYRKQLSDYLPEASVDPVTGWLSQYPVRIRITRNRISKFGDYRPPVNGGFHRISINGDLNKYRFLLILLHELAHLRVWVGYGRNARPHGPEWQSEYIGMMEIMADQGIFPSAIESHIRSAARNRRCPGRLRLDRLLEQWDPVDGRVPLESLPDGALFRIHQKRTFLKMERLRSRYRCKCLNNGRFYLVNGGIRIWQVDHLPGEKPSSSS
ncbi:MAG: SprT-like domain-containing protein [Bacteroidales bacterium]|nr:SprT-like domain-containing protein [Bacteroidales bacterium]